MPAKKKASKKDKSLASKPPKPKRATRTVKAQPRRAPVRRKKVETLPLPTATIQERMVESKYTVAPTSYVAPSSPALKKFSESRPFEFPAGYGDNRIVLMVRDPFWLYSYWEVNDQRRQEIIQDIGVETFGRSREYLRVYDTGGWNYFDIEVTGGARNWYIKIPTPNRTYCVDIGYLTPDGRFITAARSNWVTTPLDRMSEVIDEQWMIPDWEQIYALSGGFGIGRGSEEIREMMKKRLESESASGWLFSLSSPQGRPKERPFWLVANCELIVYGATEPSATVTVQGRKIDLREDGTFSLRFSLPDGQQTIPIEAIRDDGAERRKITPRVERQTE